MLFSFLIFFSTTLVLSGPLTISSISLQDKADQHERDLEQMAEIVHTLKTQSLLEPRKGFASAAINGLLHSLDPHSSFFDQEAYEEMLANQSASFSGVGIRIFKDVSRMFVSDIKEGSPAQLAGLEWGDQITHVDDIKVTSDNIDDRIDAIRGPLGSDVKFKILSYRTHLVKDLILRRGEIENTNLTQAFIIPGTETHFKTGYLKLEEFGESSGMETQMALENLVSQDIRYLIFDLRENPGGLLPQAIKIAGLFLPPGVPVVQTGSLDFQEFQVHDSSPEKPIYKGPMTILINQGTASAAEIVAGALQDHDRAVLLGCQSWGKGVVQSVFPIPPGETGLALTTARYETPLGRDIQGSYQEIFSYFQPDSGEEFYFRAKTEKDKFVTTPSGRKLYTSRGIGPDVFFYDQGRGLARQIAYSNYTMAMFMIDSPHEELMDFNQFFKEFSNFFLKHIERDLPLTTQQREAVLLYSEYVTYFKEHFLHERATGEALLEEPVIQMALNLKTQATQLALACFEKRALPVDMQASFIKLSNSFRLQQKGLPN